MKYIIYTGVLFMPDKNAAAHRANAFAEMIKNNGYTPVIVGMNKEKQNKNILATRKIFDKIIFYDLNYPQNKFEWFHMIYDIKKLKAIVNELGIQNIEAIIMMDYFSVALYRMMKWCEKKQIKLVVDTVDWFEKSNYPFPKNKIKDMDTKIRMEYIHKKASRMIVISSFLHNYYSRYVSKIVDIPGVYCSDKKIALVNQNENKVLTLISVGDPGARFQKEKIDWLIRIVSEINKNKKKIQLNIVGIDSDTLFQYQPKFRNIKNFDDSVKCLGRLDYHQCKVEISKADFSVIIRKSTLLTKAGFSTKLGESYSVGTPVFITPTSDMKKYVPEGYGIVAAGCEYRDVKNGVYSMLNVSREELKEMKEKIQEYNPLECSYYSEILNEVLE